MIDEPVIETNPPLPLPLALAEIVLLVCRVTVPAVPDPPLLPASIVTDPLSAAVAPALPTLLADTSTFIVMPPPPVLVSVMAPPLPAVAPEFAEIGFTMFKRLELLWVIETAPPLPVP